MKRFFEVGLIFILIFLLSGCESSSSKSPKLANPDAKYVGDYEKDGLYSKILEIESCTDPDKLSDILSNIYQSKFTYEKLEYDNKKNKLSFKGSDMELLIGIDGYYKIREDIMAKPNVYLFFQEFDDGQGSITADIPTFIMDKYGSYLVEEDEYKYDTSELDGEEKLYVTAWSILDLYMCERSYIEDDANKDVYSRWTNDMSFFLEFEYLTTDYLQKIGVAVKDEITGETPSSEQTLTDDTQSDENSKGEMENTFGVKPDGYFEEPDMNELEIIKEVASCTDPDEFCDILFKIYNCEFRYDVLSWDYNYKHLKSDNSGSYYFVKLFYTERPKFAHRDMISDKAYLFYRAFYQEGKNEPRFSKYPLFVMDNKGTYIIFEDKDSYVIGWSPLELYAGYNGLFRDMYPQEIQMYKDLISGFKNTVQVTEFFDKVGKYTETND